jgi:hypothetical protein
MCFSKTVVEEKQRQDELQAEVMTLMAKLQAAEADNSTLTKQLHETTTGAEADKMALTKQLNEANTIAEADKMALTKKLNQVQSENEELLLSPSLHKTIGLKVRKMSMGTFGGHSLYSLSAPAASSLSAPAASSLSAPAA